MHGGGLEHRRPHSEAIFYALYRLRAGSHLKARVQVRAYFLQLLTPLTLHVHVLAAVVGISDTRRLVLQCTVAARFFHHDHRSTLLRDCLC